MSEHERDLWAEHRDEVTRMVLQLIPEEAAEALQRVVSECTEGRQVAPALIDIIRGMLDRRTMNSA